MTRNCPWCQDDNSGYEPADDIEAHSRLCRTHEAEYNGLSVDGMERMESAIRADMADLGYFD